MSGGETLHAWFDLIRRRSLKIGGVALAVSLAGCAIGVFWLRAAPLLLGAYLIAYLFVLGAALGSLGLLMLGHLTGGAWASAIRRALEAATRTLPVVTVLFLPILLGTGNLYHEWAHPAEHDHLIAEKRAYLNVPFFLVRAAVYFASWNGLAYLLNRWSLQQEQDPSPRLARRFRLMCGPGLVLYGLTMTFAAFDWGMSLTPHWFSTIYGVMLIVGQGLTAMAMAVGATLLLADRRARLTDVPAETRADLGSLLLTFVMLWAYMSLSQLLIIWSANLPEEITWYMPRLRGGWGSIGVLLAVFHFLVPFFALLHGGVKRDPRRLIQLCGLLLVMRIVDLLWVIGAGLHVSGAWALLLPPMVAIAAAGIGGVWLAAAVRQLRARPLEPYPPVLEAAPAGPEAAS